MAGRQAEGLKDIEQAIRLDSGRPELWTMKGELQEALGNRAGATEAFQRAIAINPKHQAAHEGFKRLGVNPDNLKYEEELERAYLAYQTVKKCYDDRSGYAVVLVSEQEMNQARDAVKAIEKRFPGSLDKDGVWRKAGEKLEQHERSSAFAVMAVRPPMR
jgi:tetratricopeptide (TPR) repeat protein